MNRHSQYKRERLPQIICYTNSRYLSISIVLCTEKTVLCPFSGKARLSSPKKRNQTVTTVTYKFCRSCSQNLSYSALSVPLSIARSMTSPNSSKQTSLVHTFHVHSLHKINLVIIRAIEHDDDISLRAVVHLP